MSPLLKNALVILGLVAVLALGFYLYLNQSDSELVTVNEGVRNQALIESQAFLRRLQELREVKLDDSLFFDERFQSLVDFRRETETVEIGRNNPYAPVRPETNL